MKKNKMMRIASVLLIAVMMSTCAISGTFAKYVTSDSASDTARVAKFGVVVTATGTLFDTTYLTTSNVPGNDVADSEGTVLSVESSDSKKLVAPGTKNSDGMTFAISGTPEVDVKLDVVVSNATEIYLKQKNAYPDMTTGDATDTFINVTDYYPVKFTLTQDTGSGATALVTNGTLADIKTALEKLTAAHIDANTDLATTVGTLKLTWEWAYGDGSYDKQDTLLGALAAGTTLAPDALTDVTDYELDMDFEISITVTQID